MTFLIWQISLFLLLAALLGCVIGWFLRGHFISRSNGVGNESNSEAELKRCEERVKELEKETKQLENQHGNTHESSETKKKAKTTSKNNSAPKGSSSSKADTSTPDNLKEINGIGAVIAQALNDVDITTFAQVAKLKTGDKELIARKLKTFADRIERDKWIEQAQALHKAKYGKNP